jgi:hypothetical protein
VKRILYASTIAGLLTSGCSNLSVPLQNFSYKNVPDQTVPDQTVPDQTAPDHPSEARILYHNTQYKFTFSLPTNWHGYSVLVQQWNGQTYLPDTDKEVEADHGPVIVLRNPQWKPDDPCQDIPILVFTRRQWRAQHEGQFSIYAGGVEYEISHNAKYVVAIWSRFNGDESIKGFREAEGIVSRNEAAHAPHLYP